MEQYITFSQINDFLFSSASLYLHGAHMGYADAAYKQQPQVKGKLLHENLDAGTYSTSRQVLSGLYAWSEALQVGGRIDIYDARTRHLIERKTRIKSVYRGYVLQIYAQVYALKEGGMPVEKISLHSLEDNKRYRIPLPCAEDRKELEEVLRAMRALNARDLVKREVDARGACSIYGNLAW